MPIALDLSKFKDKAKLTDRYAKQLQRLHGNEIATGCIEEAVVGTLDHLSDAANTSMVIYGEPQSGKTEMMICLTAKLLDENHAIIVHLMNDSVDLLTQNLKRFKASGLAPAAKSLSEVLQSSTANSPGGLVVFCKKNAKDLQKLIEWIEGQGTVVVIDDEADYASPNAKINEGTKTRINELVSELIGKDGYYVGVTATPARLDLNNTFGNDTELWVNFPAHAEYTGQGVFFPIKKKDPVLYRRTLLDQGIGPSEMRDAIVRFLVTSAYLNCYENGDEENYTMLVHTSGKKQDHEADRALVEKVATALSASESQEFDDLVTRVHGAAQSFYPNADADQLTTYVVENASRATLVVLNSERDRKAAGESATEPTSPFTFIIGGNIVSRGVTFPNLLSMLFARNVKNRLQQDTYIQRARMFGARGKYLKHFELTIPTQLYADWHRCFVLHKLALATIKHKLGSPVWIGDNRVSIAANSSIDNATVSLDKGEMSFGMFDYSEQLDSIVLNDQNSINTLKELRGKIGDEALPLFVIEYVESMLEEEEEEGKKLLAIHPASSIAGYALTANQVTISRKKGFMGTNQLEPKKFPHAVYHFKIFFNDAGKARLYLKFKDTVFVENLKESTSN
ncbi:MAG TPA: Z1 domain-containing protein [Candidatus Aquilonibacter sp.]|jgi:hypothetical protein|nr:Z1 domain-containing protein [Candidatus Aquilonibacter sp.]